jgi:hypothetical protein
MSSDRTTRINLTIPNSLLDELRRYVPPRERNQFIVSATEKELKRARLAAVLEDLQREPAWSVEDHPDLETRGYRRYVRKPARWLPYS